MDHATIVGTGAEAISLTLLSRFSDEPRAVVAAR